MLTQKQLQDVCMQWHGADQCRYLNDKGVPMCMKKNLTKKQQVDNQVQKFIDTARANGQDPNSMGRALGDNCKGYVALQTIKQGYDVGNP